jgi:hypothetical protein
VAQLLDTYWSPGDLSILCMTLSQAGLDIVETRTMLGTALVMGCKLSSLGGEN